MTAPDQRAPTSRWCAAICVAAAEEMRATLIRTAFNPVIYEVLDFGISIYDADMRAIAEAPGLTMFLGANDYSLAQGGRVRRRRRTCTAAMS